MKAEATYKPSLTEKIIIIDDKTIKPTKNTPTKKKIPIVKIEKSNSKKGGSSMDKKTPTGTNKASSRKQGKSNVKGSNPRMGSKDDKLSKMITRSQSKQTRRNSLDLLVEVASFVLHGNFTV
jgi:hypothetical protein